MRSLLTKIAKAALFFAIFIILFIAVSYTLRPNAGATLHIKTFGMQPKDTIDVVYIGGSSCFTYWAPMEAWGEFGFTSFNFANNLMPAQLEKYCVKEALKRQTPSLLIVDVRPFEYAEDPIDDNESTFQMFFEPAIRNFTDSLKYSILRVRTIENSVPKENDRIDYHLDVSKYHTNLTALVNESNWKYALNKPDDKSMNFGGFEFYKLYAPINRDDHSDVNEELPLSQTLSLIYQDLVEYCSGLSTNVLFLVPPYSESEQNHMKHNYMARIATESGLPFLDCNFFFEETGLDTQTDFFNGNHTQVFGAMKYTKWLGDYISRTYNLPDRRRDSDYLDWGVAYEIWIDERQKAEQDVLALMPKDIQAIVLESMQ